MIQLTQSHVCRLKLNVFVCIHTCDGFENREMIGHSMRTICTRKEKLSTSPRLKTVLSWVILFNIEKTKYINNLFWLSVSQCFFFPKTFLVGVYQNVCLKNYLNYIQIILCNS